MYNDHIDQAKQIGISIVAIEYCQRSKHIIVECINLVEKVAKATPVDKSPGNSIHISHIILMFFKDIQHRKLKYIIYK